MSMLAWYTKVGVTQHTLPSVLAHTKRQQMQWPLRDANLGLYQPHFWSVFARFYVNFSLPTKFELLFGMAEIAQGTEEVEEGSSLRSSAYIFGCFENCFTPSCKGCGCRRCRRRRCGKFLWRVAPIPWVNNDGTQDGAIAWRAAWTFCYLRGGPAPKGRTLRRTSDEQ